MALSTSDRLQVAGIVVAVVGLVIGYVVGVIPQDVGCWTHLTSCGAHSSASAQPTATSVVPGTIDKMLPYYVAEPEAHAVSGDQAPVVGLDVSLITNVGKPVVLDLSGDGFYAYSSVRITWFTPSGSVYQRLVVPTDDRGLLQVALLWAPVPRLGEAANDGSWKISAVDQVSGQEADAQVNVESNAETPRVSDWSTSAPQAVGPPTVSAGTSGYLCTGPGAWSQIDLQGFQPGSDIDMAFYDGSEDRVLLVQGLHADAIGQVSNILDFWKILGCDSSESFDYTVVADAPSTDQRAQAEIELTTKK